MIVTCPSCDTRFSVPQSALGPRGRTLRCARCGHKWHQDAENHAEDLPEAPLANQPLAGRDTLAEHLTSDEPSAHPDFAFGNPGDHGFDAIPTDNPDEEAGEAANGGDEDPFAKISELMMARPPEPIPDVFASPSRPAARRKGAAGLWLLVVVLLLASAGAGLYFFQDRILDRWPEAARYYEQVGLRNEVVGAGLAFRNYNSERLVQNDTEVLIVRGVIANTSDQPHEIPLLRLALYNNQKLLQEKIISPPQTMLEARGTVGFRITLDQPDADASRFEVTFTRPKPPAVANKPADPKPADPKPAETKQP
jgi:predicted Zn finger-like uncharacterized protein